MLWLTWRQYRGQLLITGALLLGLGTLLLLSGLDAAGYLDQHAPPGCPGAGEACDAVRGELAQRFQRMSIVLDLLPIGAPAVIGAFWGAPLISREFERRTHRLAWTQSVPVARWLTVKLAVLSVLVLLAGMALSVMLTRWLDTLGMTDTAFGHAALFNLVGIAPAVWWLFAMLLGVAAGAVLRRTLPAMAVTIAIVAVTFPVLVLAQDAYATPVRTVNADTQALIASGSIIAGDAWVDSAGRESATPVDTLCPLPAGQSAGPEFPDRGQAACMAKLGFQPAVDHQPPSRFWLFQAIQAGILLAASAVLAVIAILRTARRRA
ncbi:ABC transporter permease subunit [Actinoplanes solisilvae]|uniref:ABC transporter permease subunit n=1 Tax=Actinoplanes solisilvae TaxID=2486853 RepID=UPI000FD771ED|nr:ABC transporter permease subunit [Actinoplanes solisilvae]